MVQLGDPYANLMGGDWNTVHIRVLHDTIESWSFAYASVVDNATNDAFFVRGVKSLFPGDWRECAGGEVSRRHRVRESGPLFEGTR